MTTAVARRPAGGRRGAKPFTVAHFRRWVLGLELDNGRPFRLQPFQAAFVSDVFGGVPQCWLVLPEGNGKTTLIAALALYHALHRESAMVPVAASSREQAEILYRQAEGFVFRSGLRGVFKCLEGYRRINVIGGNARIQVFAADDRTGDGVIPTLAICDELHRHKSLALYRTWTGKLGKRGGQIVTISTAGEPGGEFEETRQLIRRSARADERRECFVRAVSRQIALHEWAVPEGGDVEDYALVKAANPFNGITVRGLRDKRESPTMTLQHWTRFVCNLPTRDVSSAIGEQEWEAAEAEERIPEGDEVWLGLDVGWKWDTTAMVPLWMAGRELRLLGPATVLEPPRDGTSLDPHRVEAAILRVHDRNPIHTVVMDMSRAEQLASWIEEELGCRVVDRPQSTSFAVRDYELWMEALRNGWLRHSGDRVLTRHVLNAVVRLLPRGDAVFERPSRSRSGDQSLHVVDALDAAAMVHSAAVTVAEKPKAKIVSW